MLSNTVASPTRTKLQDNPSKSQQTGQPPSREVEPFDRDFIKQTKFTSGTQTDSQRRSLESFSPTDKAKETINLKDSHIGKWMPNSTAAMKAFQAKPGEDSGVLITEENTEKKMSVCWKPITDILILRAIIKYPKPLKKIIAIFNPFKFKISSTSSQETYTFLGSRKRRKSEPQLRRG